ncbi:hypothetical protein HPB49_015667 [Dermacentor silvarum]|uniref:Uncharacterized protein n=1 Tax=Dermacentor silvarum TaxID=543639 RepID=A0ACB8DPY2_DERSI|nr:uncharacterized protein LOC125940670 [Dermacentor silvarum]KAH7974449.1 hypothetical protein HPB49_015667 [Dermacentor silvarum]
MEGPRDRAPDHFVPCTAGENETCQIVDKLSTWNELLLGSQFELQEMPGTTGQLFLKTFADILPTIENFDALWIPHYPDLIVWLLRTHRCIASVYLKLSTAAITRLSVLDALRHSTWTKRVILCVEDMQAFDAAFKVIPCLTKIEELDCSACTKYEAPPEGFLTALSALFRTSSSLKCLHLSFLRLIGPVADKLFTDLLLNKHKLKELHLLDCELVCDSYPYALTEYLGTTTALNNFAVDMTNEMVQKAVLDGILQNNSIYKLLIGGFIQNEESPGIVAAVIRENSVLRNLNISIRAAPAVGPLSVYGCWLPALAQNDTLEELSFPLKVFRRSEWATFIRTLPNKENLRKVNIKAGFEHRQLLPVYAVVESLGLEEKVSVTFHCFAHDVDLLHCKAISKIHFSAGEPDDRLVAALHLLPNFQHVTDLSIELTSGSIRLSLALAEYLISTATLRLLKLSVGWDIFVETEGANPWWSVIHESLSRNKSLRELRVFLQQFNTQDIKGLADSLKRSRNIRYAEFIDMDQKNASVFVRRLSKGIADNWTLQFVLCGLSIDADAAGDWYAVCETTRRNSGLVARAARFVRASPLDRYVTGALERVSRYPVLLDDVARQAHIDKSEIVDLVRDRLKRTETLNGFMRVVGVVRERVICHPHNDDRMQLDDLIEDCWRHVRRYLLIDDVKPSIRHVENI